MKSEQDIITERYYHGVDVVDLIFFILKRSYLIVIAAVIGAVISRYYVTHKVAPVYKATSKIYIAGSDTSLSLSDLILGSTLARDYQEVFKISDVHQQVAEMLGLNYSVSKLSGMVSTSNPGDSHLLYINVQSTNAEEAQLLANTYAEVVQNYIENKMELRRPQLLEKARKPSYPISPDVKKTVKDGAVMGAMIVVIFYAFIYLIDDRIRSEEDIVRTANLPVFGSLPLERFHKGKANKDETQTDPANISDGFPRAVIKDSIAMDYQGSESINAICTGITFSGNNVRKVAITCCGPNEGKTFTALQISIGMARREKKTLLIDADLRNPVMRDRYLSHLDGSKTGLAHLLSGQCGISEALYATNIPNLFIIPDGEIVKAPLALLSSSDFDELLKKLGEDYDTIIVNTPPVGTVVDAAEIARRCDGALLVIENRKTRTKTLKEVAERLRQTQIPILGCILNKVPVSIWRYGGYGKYGNEKTGMLHKILKAGKNLRH